MRMKHFLLALCLTATGLLTQAAPLRAQSLPHAAPTVLGVTGPSEQTSSREWWRERKKRFHQLALCALASANVTYTLLVGFSGVGAAIGFSAALLGVILCL